MQALVVSNNETIAGKIREVCQRVAGHCHCEFTAVTPLEQSLKVLAERRPDMLIVALSPDSDNALAVIRQGRRGAARTIVAVGPVREAKLHSAALREGADHYLIEEELEAELESVFDRKRTMIAQAGARQGKLIAVLPSSPGCGSSTLAVNVATALAQKHRDCILIDMNLRGGDVASLLNLRPTHTLADLCENVARVDQVMFERSLAVHESGVRLLAPQQRLDDIKRITTEGVQQLLNLARTVAPYVVVDLDDFFHPEQAQTLRQADKVLLVLRLDFTSLRNARRALDQLATMNIERHKIQLVVNRYGQAQELPVAKVEEVLSGKIGHYVPDDIKTVNHANNHGIPAVLEAPGSRFSKSVSQLAVTLNGES